MPSKNNRGTKVCHYFAREWIKMGHNVQVVHYQAVYPYPYYWIAKLLRNFLAAKTGAVIYTNRDKGISRYVMDEVPIIRIPLYKPIPHGQFASKGLKKSIEEIINQNDSSHFIPDVIVGHFINPQLQVLNILKKYYKSAKTALVYHLPAEIPMSISIYGNKFLEYIDDVDILGFRNKTLEQIFKNKTGFDKKTFICYSGIPDHYITESNSHNFDGNIKSFIYVGEMIERKFPVQILDALMTVYPDNDYHIDYIGEGQQTNVIKRKISTYSLHKCVSIHGKVPRDTIKTMYDKAQCMIMISKGEAYGLVYLEAMSRGCITIASRNEGFDGIIKDGYNGFLCEAGNSDELASIIKHINTLSLEERKTISENAITTAKLLTDYNVAQLYISDLCKA